MEPHYTFHHELTNLKKKLMQLSTMVEERVRKAASIIVDRDKESIQQLILTDYQVDDMEVEIEEDCLKILALHQPVAGDLRFIIAVIKINNEMERIADMAVNIAIGVQHLENCANGKDHKEEAWIYDLSEMAEKTINMLKMSLDALVNRDSNMARRVFHLDDEVDNHCEEAYTQVKAAIRNNPSHPGCMMNLFMLAKHLERIGDRATNIAEEVIHLVEGTIVRSST